MILRDEIKRIIDCVDDRDDSRCMDQAADAIIARVLAYVTTDASQSRAQLAYLDALEDERYGVSVTGMRKAISAALGGE